MYYQHSLSATPSLGSSHCYILPKPKLKKRLKKKKIEKILKEYGSATGVKQRCQTALSNGVVKWRHNWHRQTGLSNGIIKWHRQTGLSNGIVKQRCQMALSNGVIK